MCFFGLSRFGFSVWWLNGYSVSVLKVRKLLNLVCLVFIMIVRFLWWMLCWVGLYRFGLIEVIMFGFSVISVLLLMGG